jgi:hypothetical protein
MFHSDGSFEILAQKGDLTLDERQRFGQIRKALERICTPPKQLELISTTNEKPTNGKIDPRLDRQRTSTQPVAGS